MALHNSAIQALLSILAVVQCAPTVAANAEPDYVIRPGGAPFETEFGIPYVGDVQILAGDLNGDGQDDVVVLDRFSTARVFLTDGAGGLIRGEALTLDSEPKAAALHDMNSNGVLDLVIAFSATSSPRVSIYTGDGLGGFVYQESIPTPSNIISVAVGDLFGDGSPEIATIHINAGSTPGGHVNVYAKDKEDAYVAIDPIVVTGHRPAAVAVADVTRDGRGELIVATANTTGGSALRGYSIDKNDYMEFSVSPSLDTFVPRDVFLAVHDLNGDGYDDIVMASMRFNTQPGRIHVFLSIPSGGFQRLDYLTFPNPVGLSVADFDGDGLPDILVLENQGDRGIVRWGGEDGLFTQTTTIHGRGMVHAAPIAIAGNGMKEIFLISGWPWTTRASVIPQREPRVFTQLDQLYSHTGSINAQFTGWAVADFTGDGVNEVCFAISPKLHMIQNMMDSAPKITELLNNNQLYGRLIAADYTDNGAVDLIVRISARDWIMRNLGDGDLQEPEELFPQGTAVHSIRDMTGNGVNDVVALMSMPELSTTHIVLLPGLGAGLYGEPLTILDQSWPENQFITSNFGPDGLGALLRWSLGGLWLDRPTGMGQYSTQQIFDGRVYGVAAGDLTGDGINEIIASVDAGLFIFHADKNGVYQLANQINNVGLIRDIQLADVNGDGSLDIVAGTVEFFFLIESDGAGGLLPPRRYVLHGRESVGFSVADVTGNQAPDFLVMQWRGLAGVWLLRNSQSAPCPADLVGDGQVGLADLAMLLGSWGVCPPPPAHCVADLQGDGVVGAQDLAAMLGSWGPCP